MPYTVFLAILAVVFVAAALTVWLLNFGNPLVVGGLSLAALLAALAVRKL